MPRFTLLLAVLLTVVFLASAVRGVSHEVRSNLYTNGCGGTSYFGTLTVQFETCFPNKVFGAPSCDDYIRCANGTVTTVEAFAACLPQAAFLYVIAHYYNGTTYAVNLYTDPDCTVPLSDPPVVYVHTGCSPAFYADIHNVQCNFTSSIYLFGAAASLSSFWTSLF